MSLNVTIPTPATKIKDIPTIFPQNWAAIDDAISLEHFSLTLTAEAGRHNPGISGFLLAAATSAITAVSPASGAIALDTTLGAGKTFAVTTCAWQALSYDLTMSRVVAYRAADQTVAQGATAVVAIDTETLDQLAEFNTSTNLFCAHSDGYYLVLAQGTMASIGGEEITFSISVCGTDGSEVIRSEDKHQVESTDHFSRSILSMYSLSAHECLSIEVSNTGTSGMIIEGGSERTFLVVYRLS